MEKKEAKRRIVLVPVPAYGHVTPIMQLGKALNLKGFSITVAQGQFNQVSSSQQQSSGFQFITIPGSLPESEFERLGPIEFVLELNKSSKAGFKECISQLNDIACIIYDDFMYICGVIAKDLKLPCITFSPQSATYQVFSCLLNKPNADKFLIDMEDPEMQDTVVENMHPLRYKDLPRSGYGPIGPILEFGREVVSSKRRASGVITNTLSCLESSSLSWLQQELGNPVYPLGPLHITTPEQASSLLEEERSCIEWLNKQKPRSVIYISVGTVAIMETKEVLEMAWGLCNSNQPFLWVISESLSEEVSKIISERGYIVKWAPQIQVLAHPAVGGFWSHCGWNSTLESIAEGVPMICRPFQGEQKFNALYLENVWSVGIRLEGEVERGMVERAVKRLLLDEEGEGMRERAISLREKLKASVRIGGSSYNSLDELVNYLKTTYI